MLDKKAISPVVSIALLLVISVISVVTFQIWFYGFESSLFTNAETKSEESSGIVNLVSSNLYFKNANTENISVNQVTANGIDCNRQDILESGMSSMNIDSCLSQISSGTKIEIVLYTNDNIYSKKFFQSDVSNNPPQYFERKISASGNQEYANDLIKTNDGGFLVVGRTNSYNGSNHHMLLIKFDGSGVEQWTKVYGDTGVDEINSVIQTSQGDFILIGESASYSGIILSKFDSNGVEQWTKKLGSSSQDAGYDIVETSDGSFVISGRTVTYGAGNSDIILSKFNSSGNEKWTKTLGGTGHEKGYSLVETNDGGFVVSGYTSSHGSGSYDVILSKFSSNGVEQWTKAYGSSDYDEASTSKLIELSNGDLVLAGLTYSSPKSAILSKFDSSGVEQWTKKFGSAWSTTTFTLTQTNEGGFLVGHSMWNLTPSFKYIVLSKFDNSGYWEWSKNLSRTNIGSILQTNNGNFVFAGYDLNDIYLAKLDSNGNCGGCDEVDDLTLIVNDWNPTESIWTISEFDQVVSESNIDITEINISTPDSDKVMIFSE